MKIIFIRTAEYQYKQPEQSLFDSLDVIGQQTVQPNILKPSRETLTKVNLLLKKYKPTKFFCSEFFRSQQTAKLFSPTVKIAPQLNEIKFSMNTFSSPQELPGDNFETKTINKIRYNFSCALLDDSLQEKQKNIMERIINFIFLLNQAKPNTTILCCSHGFILKLYENFFLTKSENYIFENIVKTYNWKKPPFDFLDGFIVELDNNDEIKISKIPKCLS